MRRGAEAENGPVQAGMPTPMHVGILSSRKSSRSLQALGALVNQAPSGRSRAQNPVSGSQKSPCHAEATAHQTLASTNYLLPQEMHYGKNLCRIETSIHLT